MRLTPDRAMCRCAGRGTALFGPSPGQAMFLYIINHEYSR